MSSRPHHIPRQLRQRRAEAAEKRPILDGKQIVLILVAIIVAAIPTAFLGVIQEDNAGGRLELSLSENIRAEVRQRQRDAYDEFLSAALSYSTAIQLYELDIITGAEVLPSRDDLPNIPQEILDAGFEAQAEVGSVQIFGSEAAAILAQRLYNAIDDFGRIMVGFHAGEATEEEYAVAETEFSDSFDLFVEQVRIDVRSAGSIE